MTEGRKRAVANGVKFGPKFKLNSFQRQEALARLAAGGSQSVVAKTYGVDPATISRLLGRRLAPTKAAGGFTPTGGQRHATTVARRVSRQAHRRSPATNRSRAEH